MQLYWFCLPAPPQAYKTNSQYDNIDAAPQEFYTFYVHEKIDFEYSPIEYVLASTQYGLKHKSYTQGANGVLFVETEQEISGMRKCSTTGNVYIDKSTQWKGLAVKISTNDAFLNKYQNRSDVQFFHTYYHRKKQEDKLVKGFRTSSFLSLTGITVLALLVSGYMF